MASVKLRHIPCCMMPLPYKPLCITKLHSFPIQSPQKCTAETFSTFNKTSEYMQQFIFVYNAKEHTVKHNFKSRSVHSVRLTVGHDLLQICHEYCRLNMLVR